MNRALQITYRGMATSDALSEHIRDHAEKLEQFFDGIVGCHVVVEEPHRHKQQGNPFHVRVDLHVPGKDIVVGNDSHERTTHVDAYQAVSAAFDAARRQLQHYADSLHGHRR
ncbi:RNA polymerase subunit sigma-54 [Corallococcus sp. H22C18031201]|uniref:HPF/RaiA family ribosome-associated protein n=1 Tax=Citreicoccus inhibens TaxID=2849499 RepID=UPI000E768538|nr:HPF/RaiA family ribosome-associated protein [Citreicoccus inhibens]MBU8895809.1 HPF/RaiA family ribosome-associated protein [Citreicoccus inhibens]RJS20221.1 RNA polymerase subunit sigma-54 [Corallococcus sp. H22C18031201]